MPALALTLLALQSVPPPDGSDRLSVRPPACPAGPSADGTIVVCGRRTDQRLHPLPPPPGTEHRDPATFRLPGGGTAHVHAFQSELPGAVGQGAAVTLTVPFGRKKRAEGD